MKKFILALLVCIAALGISGASTASAQQTKPSQTMYLTKLAAANKAATTCTLSTLNTFWNGVLNYYAEVYCPSNVQYIDFAGGGSGGRWWDETFMNGQNGLCCGGWGTTNPYTTGNTPQAHQIQTRADGGNTRLYSHFSWCAGANHGIHKQNGFRVMVGGVWGYFVYGDTGSERILC